DGVVLRDRAAQADAGEEVEVGEHGIADRAADVVEVDIDAVRARRLDGGGKVRLRLVVDAGIEPQLVLDVGALLGSACDADGAAAGNPGDLAHDLADCAGGGGDHHGLTGLGPPDLQEAEVGGHAGHAEHAVGVGDGPVRRVDPAGGAAGTQG